MFNGKLDWKFDEAGIDKHTVSDVPKEKKQDDKKENDKNQTEAHKKDKETPVGQFELIKFHDNGYHVVECA